MKIGIPAKGRMAETLKPLLKEIGLTYSFSSGSARSYVGTFEELPYCEVYLMQPVDLTKAVKERKLDCCFTGYDFVKEIDIGDRDIIVLEHLGVSRASLIVAVPDGWLDVNGMHDLEEVSMQMISKGRLMRVATKYKNLTKQFFKSNGITNFLIVDSLGATEIAPHNNYADIIVDITSTGKTVADNNLKILDNSLIVDSDACLVCSTHIRDDTKALEVLRMIVTRLRANKNSRNFVNLQALLPEKVEVNSGALNKVFGASYIYPPINFGNNETLHSFAVSKDKMYDLQDALQNIGVKHVIVSSFKYLFEDPKILAKEFDDTLDI